MVYEPKWVENARKNFTYCEECKHKPSNFSSCRGCAWICKKGHTVSGTDYYSAVRCRDYEALKELADEAEKNV